MVSPRHCQRGSRMGTFTGMAFTGRNHHSIEPCVRRTSSSGTHMASATSRALRLIGGSPSMA